MPGGHVFCGSVILSWYCIEQSSSCWLWSFTSWGSDVCKWVTIIQILHPLLFFIIVIYQFNSIIINQFNLFLQVPETESGHLVKLMDLTLVTHQSDHQSVTHGACSGMYTLYMWIWQIASGSYVWWKWPVSSEWVGVLVVATHSQTLTCVWGHTHTHTYSI